MALVRFDDRDVYINGSKSSFQSLSGDIWRNPAPDQDMVHIRDEDFVARRDKSYLLLLNSELKTVEDCKRALEERKLPSDQEYFRPWYRGKVAGKHLYVLETLNPDHNKRFHYQLANPPKTLAPEEVERRAAMCRQIRNNLLYKLPEDHFRAVFTYEDEKREVRAQDESKLTLVGEYPTFHTFGYVLLFKPSVAEAVSQLPADLFVEGKKYLIKTEAATTYAPQSHIYDTWHIAVTTVYEDPGDPAMIDLIVENVENKEKSESRKRKVRDFDLCIICMDNPAVSTALPCGHVSICRPCSVKLEDTPDAKVCVRCRRKIGTIPEDAV